MSHFVKGILKQKTVAKPSSLKRADGTYTKNQEEALLEQNTNYRYPKLVWDMDLGKEDQGRTP